jgi:hypothetical protein
LYAIAIGCWVPPLAIAAAIMIGAGVFVFVAPTSRGRARDR